MWSEYLHLLRDPAHILFELTMMVVVDGLLIGVGWRLGMKWVRKHDQTHHEPGVPLHRHRLNDGTVTHSPEPLP